jgi:hypothetical protein
VLVGGIGMEVNDENTIDLTPEELAALVGEDAGADAGAVAETAPPSTPSSAADGTARLPACLLAAAALLALLV